MWFGNQFDFFYFCFGLVCLLLWTSCRSLSIHQRKEDAIGWLGGFGLLQGIGHWIGLLETQWHDVPVWLADAFFVFACLSLLIWACRIWSERLGVVRSRILALSLLSATLVIAFWLPPVFAVALVAGLPASLAGGVHLFLRKQSLLKTAAFALIIHGISLALFVPMTEPGWLPGAGAAYWSLLPVGLGYLCTLSMLVLATTLWRFDWMLNDSAVAYGSLRHRISVRYSRQIFVVILFLVVLTGWVAMRKSGETAARQYTDRWFRQAEAAARTLARAYEAELKLLGRSGEQQIQTSLSADEITWLHAVNEGFQQLLIVRLEGDALKVQADSGRPGSPLKGLPDSIRRHVMDHQDKPGRGILFDSIHDAWGERRLALFPLSVGGGAPSRPLWLVVEFNQGKLMEQVSRYRFYAILAMVMVVLLVFAADQQIRLNQAQMVLAEKHSHQLLASMNEGYAVFEVRGEESPTIQLVESNPSYDEWCGRSRATLREDQPGGIFPGAEDAWKEEILRVSAAGGGGHFRVGESDAARILDVSLYRVQPGRVACVIADRTREVRKDEALKQSEARFRALVERSPVGIIVRNAGDVILDVNPALSRMLNQSRNQLIGQRFLPMLHPTEAPGEAKNVQRVMAGDVATREIRMKRTDGGWIDMELQETRFLLPDGTHGVMSMTLDITDRKQAAEKMVEVERNLRHAQKLESLGVMAGGIAHDFNNLLMGMMGNLDLSLMEVPRGSSLRSLLEDAFTAAKRAAELTDQMLAYSGRGAFTPEAFQMNPVLDQMRDLLRVVVPKEVPVHFELTDENPYIMGDASQVQQVLVNIVQNAGDAVSVPSGRVTIRTRLVEAGEAILKQSRTASIPKPGRYVVLEVEDNGCGMNEETQEKIFDPFFTTKFIGRGLGMSAVLGILQAHHGAVFIRSVPGEGTLVQLYFPATEISIEEQKASETAREDAVQGQRGAILLVDDEASVRTVCSLMLARIGYEVIAAEDGEQAVSIFQERAPDIRLALLDLTMPKLNGVDTLKLLREVKPDLPAVIASGYSSQEIRTRLQDLPRVSVIQKPYTMQRLIEALMESGATWS